VLWVRGVRMRGDGEGVWKVLGMDGEDGDDGR
jgi:hypothetical protein